jgi:hypothetical protein
MTSAIPRKINATIVAPVSLSEAAYAGAESASAPAAIGQLTFIGSRSAVSISRCQFANVQVKLRSRSRTLAFLVALSL